MSRCQACDAPLRWARTAKGRAMPLDLLPTPTGNVHLKADGTARVLSPLELELDDGTRPRYMPHHATCPHAADFRSRGR